MSRVDITVPDLGSFSDVPVIDVLVKPGDTVEVDTPLITLETDKATMDVPSSAAGKIVEVSINRGDKVSKGTLIARVETAEIEDTQKLATGGGETQESAGNGDAGGGSSGTSANAGGETAGNASGGSAKAGSGTSASTGSARGSADYGGSGSASGGVDRERAARGSADYGGSGSTTGGVDRDRAAPSASSSASSDRRAPARPESGGDTVRMPGPGSAAAAKAAAQISAKSSAQPGDGTAGSRAGADAKSATSSDARPTSRAAGASAQSASSANVGADAPSGSSAGARANAPSGSSAGEGANAPSASSAGVGVSGPSGSSAGTGGSAPSGSSAAAGGNEKSASSLGGSGDARSASSSNARASVQPEARAPSEKNIPAPAGKSDSSGKSAPGASTPSKSESSGGKKHVVVLGAGPGGYTAAFRAADLGLQVTLIDRWSSLGGVCLNVGCIPSKALLHAAKVIEEAHSMSAHGVSFGKPTIDLPKLRDWKTSVVKKLTGGLKMLAKQRKVEVIQGTGRFTGPNAIEVTDEAGKTRPVNFDYCIIAAGSEPVKLPNIPNDPRIIDSTGALELPENVKRLLVIGGGIIGLEMACVYDALGTKVSVCELLPNLMPGADPDLVKPLEKRIRARYEQILLGTKVTGIEARPEGLRVTFEGAKAPEPQMYDRVLVAVGRVPNGKAINAEAAGVKVTDRGFITTDKQMRTNVPHIFAIGDIVGQPMLAHKAMHEAKVAAEVAAGEKSYFDARTIPSVAYTDPEVAWAGITETEAAAKNIPVKKGAFPWVASGRSLSLGRDEGFTKLLFDPESHRLLGAGIVGPNAGELIAELVLGIEMGVDATDISLSVHPHPTLSETVGLAAEAFEGTLTDLYIPKR